MTYPRSRRDGWRIRSVVVRSLAVGAFLVVPLQAAAQVNGAQAALSQSSGFTGLKRLGRIGINRRSDLRRQLAKSRS